MRVRSIFVLALLVFSAGFAISLIPFTHGQSAGVASISSGLPTIPSEFQGVSAASTQAVKRSEHNLFEPTAFLSAWQAGIESNNYDPRESTTANALSSSAIQSVGANWIPLGPQPITNALNQFTWGTAPFSGRVTAIAVNETNPSIVYVGGAQGGIWKSVDGGSSFVPISDSQPSLATGAITISPDGKTLYVGTGEPNRCGDCYYGDGLLESTNEGLTWSLLGNSVFGDSAISSVLVNSANPSVLLVSTTSAACCRGLAFSENPSGIGVFRSTDGGQTWTNVLSPSSGSGVAQLLQDPNNTNVDYASDFSGSVWQSTDGGSSWAQILGETQSSEQGRVAIAVSSSLQNIIFAAFVDQSGSLIGIFEYNVSNGTVTTLGTPPNPNQIANNTPCGPAGSTQCWYDLLLAVDPTNPNNIYFGGVDLYESTNGGQSWTDLGGYESGSALHPDQHALVFVSSSSGTIYEGNDGGLWSSTNYGSGWTDLNSQLEITQFYSVATSPNSDSSMIGGTQDNACVQYSGTASWAELTTGDGGWTGIESTNPSIMYCMYTGLNFQKSTDGGATWSFATTGLNLNDQSLFIAPVAQDPNNPGTIYLAGTQVYKTTNYASNWVNESGPIGGVVISAITVAPSNSSVLYLGDMNGNVKLSTNAGQTWQTIATESSPISSIVVDPSNYQTAYVALAVLGTPTLLKTTNEGSTWQSISLSGLESASINVVKIDPVSGAIFLGTDNGVYYSADGGTSWELLGSGLPNAAVFDIGFTQSDQIIAATHGRGVWEQPAIGSVVGLTLSYSIVGGGSSYRSPQLYYVENGIRQNTSLSTSPATYYVDSGSTWNVTGTLSGSGASERWQTNQATSEVATSSLTENFEYYHQYLFSTDYSVLDGGTGFSAPSLSYTSFGTPESLTLTASLQSAWGDSGSSWSVTDPLSGSTPSERWSTAIGSGTVSSNSPVSFVYYNQYAFTGSYSILGGGNPNAPTLSSTQYGNSYDVTFTISASIYWLDALSSWSITNPLSGSTSNERWQTISAVSGTVSSADTLTPVYYHQYLETFDYSVFGGGSPVAPVVTLSQFGSPTSSTTSLSGCSTCTTVWVDSSTLVIYQSPLNTNPATINEQWNSSSASFIISSHGVLNPTYYNQYWNTFEAVSKAQANFDSSLSITITGRINGVSGTVCTMATTPTSGVASCSGYADAGSIATWAQNATGAASGVRWQNAQIGSSESSINSGGNSFVADYYKQVSEEFSYSITGGGSPGTPLLTYSYLSSPTSVALTTASTSYWLDYGSGWSIANTLSGSSGTERWYSSPSSVLAGTVSSPTPSS